VFLSTIKKGGGKYCSKKCYSGSSTKVERICMNCGEKFLVERSRLKRGGRAGCFCSPSCRMTKENNHKWTGGKSIVYPISFSKEFKEKIRIRDNYKCAICGYIHATSVHHVDYVKENTTPENCITLCSSCHSKTNSNREYWQGILSPIARERSMYG
jgi:hypothetical protein